MNPKIKRAIHTWNETPTPTQDLIIQACNDERHRITLLTQTPGVEDLVANGFLKELSVDEAGCGTYELTEEGFLIAAWGRSYAYP